MRADSSDRDRLRAAFHHTGDGRQCLAIVSGGLSRGRRPVERAGRPLQLTRHRLCLRALGCSQQKVLCSSRVLMLRPQWPEHTSWATRLDSGQPDGSSCQVGKARRRRLPRLASGRPPPRTAGPRPAFTDVMAEDPKADEQFGKWRGWIRFTAVLCYVVVVMFALTLNATD